MTTAASRIIVPAAALPTHVMRDGFRLAVRWRCSECLAGFPTFELTCPSCGEFNSVFPVAQPAPPTVLDDGSVEAVPVDEDELEEDDADPGDGVQRLCDVDIPDIVRVPTGIRAMDEALGDDDEIGMAIPSVVLIAGLPGCGKSSLFLQMLVYLAANGMRTLYVSAEESIEAVHRRAKRLGFPKAARDRLLVVKDRDLDKIYDVIDNHRIDMALFDSIGVMELAGTPMNDAGLPKRVDSIFNRVYAEEEFKGRRKMAGAMIVGHAAKDGSTRGPEALVHHVDVAFEMEYFNPKTGERIEATHQGRRKVKGRRLLPKKNRFGDTNEVWLKMGRTGLEAIPRRDLEDDDDG